ncbi:hypothetical protein Scep_025405 [Stephania cephalantha]|uniref:Uncharacterized protein n=1 Tax=Stephania cephalantha TaxID=152367 RepID=A0AAP0EI62_9MAGN
MEKFENVDYNELGFDPHIYGLLTDWRWLSGLQWNSLLADLVGSYRSQRISKSKQSNLEVNYGSVENASIVYAALAVDKEVFQRVQSLEVPMTRKCDATRLKECLLLSMHGVQSIVSHPWWLEENIIPRPRMHIFPLT